jgi:hypothetical protein
MKTAVTYVTHFGSRFPGKRPLRFTRESEGVGAGAEYLHRDTLAAVNRV